jgi:hypothetical protein
LRLEPGHEQREALERARVFFARRSRYDPAMKHEVTQFKSLAIALKELERFVRNGRHLQTGKPFKRLGLRSREALANWLLCAAVNHASKEDRLTFTSDPDGGDGIIFDKGTGETARTEHVYVPGPNVGGKKAPAGDVETLMLKAIAKKQAKGGAAYASGKTLVVFSDAVGQWFANKVARQLPSPLDFEAVWVVALHGVEKDQYVYNVTRLDLTRGNAPVWRVTIAPDFGSWHVEPVQ